MAAVMVAVCVEVKLWIMRSTHLSQVVKKVVEVELRKRKERECRSDNNDRIGKATQ